MRTTVVYSPDHALHEVEEGLWVGAVIPTDEVGARAEVILGEMKRSGREIVSPAGNDDSILESVHDRSMLDYMSTAHRRWSEWGYADDPGQANVIAYAFPTAAFLGGLGLRLPTSPGALAGVYAMDTMTPIGPGTWEAARAAVDVAQTAAAMAARGEPAYALCRPPGHHAGSRFFGGSCYLNNAAVAAETMRAEGMGRVAIIDIDAHHGNGTQEIFYGRGDVVYASVHVDPGEGWFPHFVGFVDETGSGAGVGANLNVPVAPGSGDETWLSGVDEALSFLSDSQCEGLVVSLGVDAAAVDPESPLEVTEAGFEEAGRQMASLRLPTVLVQEGGYDLDTIGSLVESALSGFEGRGRP